MLRYFRAWLRMLRSEKAQDLAEYALLVALIAVALLFVFGAMAGGIANTMNHVRNALFWAHGREIPS